MLLTDISFLFYFLPLFLAVYYITSKKQKHLAIVAGSLIFYSLQYGVGPWQLVFLLVLVGFTWLVGMAGFQIPAVVFLAALLALFKTLEGGVFLAAGMSFYLFQMMAYLVDIKRKRLDPETDLASFAAQILLFPKLLSGPLMEPLQLKAQMAKPKFNSIRFRGGLQELILGLSMKVLLADRLTGLWNQAAVIGYDSIGAGLAWAALVGFGLRLYFDFHGYSLMAVGLGKMLGFLLPPNFSDPYAARSVSDFYNRWHMTLYRWFREYIYFPLGGSRKGKLRTVLNVLVVWVITGLWHGIGGNYLLWAMFLAFWIIQEKLWLGKILKRTFVFAHVYTVVLILLSWVPFAIGDWGQMVKFLKSLFRFEDFSGALPAIYNYLPILCMGVLLATPLTGMLFDRFRESVIFDVLLFVVFWVCIYFISTASQDPFLYFCF